LIGVQPRATTPFCIVIGERSCTSLKCDNLRRYCWCSRQAAKCYEPPGISSTSRIHTRIAYQELPPPPMTVMGEQVTIWPMVSQYTECYSDFYLPPTSAVRLPISTPRRPRRAATGPVRLDDCGKIQQPCQTRGVV
jgi:hypothetical protein